MSIHWSLSDSKSPQVSRTRLSILADLSNAVSTRGPISNSSNPHTKYLWSVPCASIIIGITVTFTFHNVLALWQDLSTCLSSRFLWVSLFGPPYDKVLYSASSSSFFFKSAPGLVFWSGLGDLFASQNPRESQDYYYYYYYYYFKFFPPALADG